MLAGSGQTLEQDRLYESTEAERDGRAHSASHRAWLFICQVSALLWKETIDRVRRPRCALVELFLPVLVVLVLLYTVSLSPVATVDSFRHADLPTVSLHASIPNETKITSVWADDVSEVMKWRDVFSELNLSVFFLEYAQTLAKLHNVTRIYKRSDIDTSWSSMWTPEEVTNTVLTNRPAASVFKVPTFDEYTNLISMIQMSIGNAGMKRTMYDDPLIRFIFQFGRLAFALGDVRGPERAQLLVAIEKIIEYFNATTKSFGNTVICRSAIVNGETSSCAFQNVREVVALKSSNKFPDALWAVVRIDRLSLFEPDFRYAVLIKRTLMPRWMTIETFPQGLGKEYATYAYSGVLTLQYELNTYFAALVGKQRQQQTNDELPLTLLVDSICDAVPTPHNAARGLFILPTDATQREIVKNATVGNPIEIVDVRPFIGTEAIFAPCRYEVSAFCETAKNTTSLIDCLENVSEVNVSVMCRGAMQFILQCLPTTTCENENVFDLLTNVPSKLSSCVDSMADTCDAKSYPHAVAQSRSAAACADELRQVCSLSFFNGHNIFTDCARDPPKQLPKSEVCQAVLESFQPCLDEYESICPTKGFGDPEAIPYACLYRNTHILSDSCQVTRLVKEILPNMFTREVIRQKVDAATYYCREVHDVQKTLTSSIVAQAFPTKSYNQHLFFVSAGPFVGLLLAAAYYFPFSSSVQSMARERESWQYMYMILIGTHPLAILFSRFLASFAISFIVSLFVTLAVMISVDVPSWALYSLLYMYSLSLSAFSMVVGAVIPTERAATIISPFIMFLSVAPALSLDNPTTITGFSSILPPTVLAKAVNQFSRGAQTGYVMSAVGPFTPQRALWTLFGLTIMYGLIAVLLEYLILPNSGLDRLFQCMTNKITSSVDRLMKRQRRQVASHFEGEELFARDNYIQTPSRNAQATEFNIGGINNTTEAAARFQPNAGVGIPAAAELRDGYPSTGETLASLMSPSGSGAASTARPSTFWPRVPLSWRSAVAVRNLEYDIPGLGFGLHIPQADFFRDQLNCLVGRAGAGKSLLLQVLMSWSDRPYGSVQINGRDLWMKGQDAGGIGVCLQRTVVWENMTVGENIRLVQLLSGRIADDVELEQEQNTLIAALQLVDVCRERAGRLTPGLARKLAVAMAFAGGARTVLLDEPTACTDLSSRAEIWHIISQNTRQRCVIVATTDVDQVGRFADHVTVLHRGCVSMAGTPEYIKRRLCGGWVITVCRAFHTRSIDIIDRVMTVAPEAVLVSNVSNELAFRIPENVASVYVPKLLTEMQRAKQSNLITNIAVSDAHFSEAFVRLARALDLREPQCSDSDDQNDDGEHNNDNGNGGPLLNEDPAMAARSYARYRMMSSAESRVQSAPFSAYHRVSDSRQSNAAAPHRTLSSPLNTIGTVEEREARYSDKSKVFLRTWLGILYYRALDAVMSPFYAFLSLLLPLALIAFASGFISSNIIYERFAESSLTEWEISSSLSTSYYTAFGGETSLYRKFIGNLNGKRIPSTMSSFSQIENNETERVAMNSSVAVDDFLYRKDYPANLFLFGAFALQGPMFTVLDTSSVNRNHFPWVTDIVLHNTSYPPSLPAYIQLLGMMRIWAVSNDMNATISASVGVSETELRGGLPSTVIVMSTLLLLLPFAFYGSRMVSNLVEQRRSGLLQVLYSSSLHPAAFWLANFTYDILSFMILSFAGVVMYYFSNAVLMIPGEGMMVLFGTMFVFGCSIISLSYVISKCFNNPVAAQLFAIGLVVFTGFAFLIASSGVRFLPKNPMTASSIKSNEGYAMLMRIFPLFSLGETFMSYAINNDPDWDGNQGVSLLPLIVPVILFILLIVYESTISVNLRTFLREKMWRPLDKEKARLAARLNTWFDSPAMETAPYRWEDPAALLANEDPSVAAERCKGYTADGLHAAEVWKMYHDDVYALQNISVNVGGESLVVVGVNGCGKSTLLRCLSGDLLPSHGSIFINGNCSSFNTRSRLNANRFIGYATASAALQESSLTPYVFLNVMADLRIVRRGEMRKQHILFLLRTLGVEPFMHVSLMLLSVSVQRRVEIAAALIGYPPVLVLDDLTGSLDPVARRQVWAAVKSSPHGTTTVLSTRSIDDVEMLGDRVLLLDEGTVKFVGTPAEWRRSHRSGFKVSIDVPRSIEARGNRSYHAEERNLLRDFFAAHWEGSSLLDSQPFHYTFHIPPGDTQNEEIEISSSSSTASVAVVGIRSILSTLILGRNSGWEVEGGSDLQMYFKCSIAVSEISVEDTAMAAFTKSSRNLYDRNYYIPPRDYSVTI